MSIKRLILLCSLFVGNLAFSQYYGTPSSSDEKVKGTGSSEDRTTITIGLFEGGGGLVGVELESLLNDRIGFEIGFGIVSFSLGLNYHLGVGGVKSSFIGIKYSSIGMGPSHMFKMVGPEYTYRSKKWFTGSIGFGGVVDKGPYFK
ncbi:MAG: hypothetical protein ACJAY8_001173, partial [Sphingobacteriales bacterium]